MSDVYSLCEQAIGLVRGKRLVLTSEERAALMSLKYETLTSLHAQDEAVVCALHFERVRDRLLQIYPWVFARKTASITRGTLPSDCLTVLCVLVNEEPVEYEQVGTKLNVTEDCTVHYTARVSEISSWSAIYQDVFVYSLAVEICPAVTGKPEYAQVLEQKVQELIQRAYQIGAIKADTHLTLKEEIYNRAIALSHGQRTMSPTSGASFEQGTDNLGDVNHRRREELNACKRAAESVRDRLLELYAWTFARRKKKLNSSTGSISGWKHDYILPEDCLRVLCLVSDDGALTDYEEGNGEVYCDAYLPELRYTARVEDMTKWSGSFIDVYVCSLSQEVILATTQNLEAVQLLEQKAQQLIRNAVQIGAIRAETELSPKEELYQRAIALAHGQRSVNPSSSASSEQGIDVTGNLSVRYREEVKICRRSYEYLRDKLLKLYGWEFARKPAVLTASAKVSGWSNAYVLPADCMKALCVLSNDEPIEYEVSDGKVLCNASGASLRYTRRVDSLDDLDAGFVEALTCELAVEIVTGTVYSSEQIQLLEQREQSVIQRCYRLGVIHEESRIPVKDELIDRAMKLAYGTRTLSPVSDVSVVQGTDNAGIIDDRYRQGLRAARLSYDNVRDKLQEMYAWTFLRKTARITDGVLPADCLNVLAVLVNGEPVEWEISSGRCSVGTCELRYISRNTDASSWSAVFRESFCYKLAIEIVTSTTGNVQTVQQLEQGLSELILRARQLGAIHEETRVTLKQELYNRAISLARGQRSVNPSSEVSSVQGLDNAGIPNWRVEAEVQACLRSSDSVRDRLLQLYAWVFAKRSVTPSGTGTIAGWTNGYVLPSGCLTVLTVLEDGEPIEWEVSDGKVYCNGSNVTVRYIEQVPDMSSWPGAFRDAFCYGLAQEIANSTLGATELITQLEQRFQVIIRDAYKVGAIKPETRIPVKYELFNRAIGLVKGIKTGSIDVLDTRLEDEVSACYRSYETLRDRLLQMYEWVFARKTEIPAQLSESVPGWRYTYLLPEDCLKVLSVISEDVRAGYGLERQCMGGSEQSGTVELLDYETAGRELYVNHSPVYVRYTARITDSKHWAASFTDALVILIAIEICHNVTDALKAIQLLEQRLAMIIEGARSSGVIRPETRLPMRRDSRYKGTREVPYLDYSGLPTMPCMPLDYCGRVSDERISGEFCVR